MTKSPGTQPRKPRTSKPDAGDPNWVRPANLPPEILALESAARALAAAPTEATARQAYSVAESAVRALAKRYGRTNSDLRSETENLLVEVQAGLERSRVSKVEKAIYWWAYHRDRIAGRQSQECEEARAFAAVQLKDAAKVPWVVGFRWMYRPGRGRSCEQCKALSTTNAFGLGPGGYPKDRVPPYPAHDGCCCYLDDIVDQSVEPTEAEWAALGLGGDPEPRSDQRLVGSRKPHRSAWATIARAILAVFGAVFGILGAILSGLFGRRRRRRR